MAIAGTIIVINSNNPKLSTDIALKIRDIEQNKSYFHVGLATLTEHFLPSKHQHEADKYMLALFGAISGSARSGNDIIADLNITTSEQFAKFKPFIEDLEVIWVNVGLNTEFINSDLSFNINLDIETIAQQILAYLDKRYKYALSHSRWATEVSPVTQASQLGKVILLIGASSAGKSTLSKAIQELSNEVFLNVGIDTAVLKYLHLRYLNGVPEHEHDESWREPNHNPTEHHKLGTSWIKAGPDEYNPFDYLRMRFGIESRHSISAMYATIAEMSKLGFNVISDHCFHYADSLAEAIHRFQGLPVTYVSLCPSLETIELREKQRGDRMNGMGRSVYYQMINSYKADIKLDTGKYSPAECAQKVITFITS